jgi:ligand-binding sensor domain-containing protein
LSLIIARNGGAKYLRLDRCRIDPYQYREVALFDPCSAASAQGDCIVFLSSLSNQGFRVVATHGTKYSANYRECLSPREYKCMTRLRAFFAMGTDKVWSTEQRTRVKYHHAGHNWRHSAKFPPVAKLPSKCLVHADLCTPFFYFSPTDKLRCFLMVQNKYRCALDH